MTDMYSRGPRYVRKANVTPYKYCLSKVPEINDDTGESYMTVKWHIGQSRLPSANIRLNGLST